MTSVRCTDHEDAVVMAAMRTSAAEWGAVVVQTHGSIGRRGDTRHGAPASFYALAARGVACGDPRDADVDPWLCYAISEREAAELRETLSQLGQRGVVT